MSNKFKRILFLDIDGVLINRESLLIASGFKATPPPYTVANLNYITQNCKNCQIVVSSTWRLAGLEFVQSKLVDWGVEAPIIDITTPQLLPTRGQEIQEWISKHSEERFDFLVLDDSSDISPFESKRIHPSFEKGLTRKQAKAAIRLFYKPRFTPKRGTWDRWYDGVYGSYNSDDE